MGRTSLVRDGWVDDLVFRKHRGLWRPNWHVYSFFVGEEAWGFIVPSSAWKEKWDAHSYNWECPNSLRQCGGFATRLDAGIFIVKTYGYWENN